MLEVINGLQQQLCIKLPFHNPLFLENENILNWEFSKSVLITAYDLLRDDRLITDLQRSGSTLKEYLKERGFNPEVEIFADTGIFALEFRKSRMKDSSIKAKLQVNDIFMAYELIDPDYLIAPDEIITLKDDLESTLKKLDIIEANLSATVDRFDRDKIYATIQGLEFAHMQRLGDNIQELKIKNAARGGLIPLRRNYAAYKRILTESETIARLAGIENLHAFGMPGIASLKDIFIANSYDSVDTSTIYFYTVDHQYINNQGELIRVKDAHFNLCECIYCDQLQLMKEYPTSGRFMMNLFGHNASMMNRFMEKLDYDPRFFDKIPRKYYIRKVINRASFPNTLTPADKIDEYKKLINSSEMHNKRIETKIEKNGKGILVISSCSQSKKYRVADQPDYFRLQTKEDRENELLKFEDILLPANEMYCGWQHRSISKAINILRNTQKVDHFIVSAGFGLIKENTMIPPYDTTFSGRTDREIDTMSESLQIRNKLMKLNGYRLAYIALSRDYIKACGGLDTFKHLGDEVVIFGEEMVDAPLFSYSTNEFRYLEQEGLSFEPDMQLNLRIKGDILQNFARSREKQFINYWHSLIYCNCTH